MSGIQMAAPEGQYKLQVSLLFLSLRMTLQSLATPYLSCCLYYQVTLATGCISSFGRDRYSNIDLEMGRSKFRFTPWFLNFLLVTSENCLVCVRKGHCLKTRNKQLLCQTVYSLPDSNSVTATNHVTKRCLISRSAYEFVRHHLVPLIPWTPCYYKIFMNRGNLKCKI